MNEYPNLQVSEVALAEENSAVEARPDAEGASTLTHYTEILHEIEVVAEQFRPVRDQMNA